MKLIPRKAEEWGYCTVKIEWS